MGILNRYSSQPTISVDSSKGSFSLTYKDIFNKINQILKSENPIMISHIKAARLLYIVHNIRIKNNQFHVVPLGGIDLMVVHDNIGDSGSDIIYDIAQLGDTDMIFIFRDSLVNEHISTQDKFINLYSLYNLLVAIFVKPSLCVCYESIYNTIARYAPYVLTVKTLLSDGINVKIDDIDFSRLPEEDTRFINETTLDIIKDSSEEDLLSYGVLCEFAK